jgi:hypothetical protein
MCIIRLIFLDLLKARALARHDSVVNCKTVSVVKSLTKLPITRFDELLTPKYPITSRSHLGRARTSTFDSGLCTSKDQKEVCNIRRPLIWRSSEVLGCV